MRTAHEARHRVPLAIITLANKCVCTNTDASKALTHTPYLGTTPGQGPMQQGPQEDLDEG